MKFKNIKRISFTIIIMSFFLMIFINSPKVYAQSTGNLIEIWFETNGEKTLNKADLEIKNGMGGRPSKAYQYIEVTIKAKSNVGRQSLASFSIEFEKNDMFLGFANVKSGSEYPGFDDWKVVAHDYFSNPSSKPFIGFSYDPLGEEDVESFNRWINEGETIELATAHLIYNPESIENDLETKFKLEASRYKNGISGSDLLEYSSEEISISSFVVGQPGAADNSNLSSLKIGETGQYENSIGTVPKTKNITLSYQDSLKELFIETTKEKASATQVIQIERKGELIPYSTAIPYQSGDELIITVTDGKSETPYKRPITVDDPSPNTEITLTTDKSSEISEKVPGQFTIKVPFSVTDLTITVTPLDFATASKTTIKLTQLSATSPHEETITITAEDGITTKDVTITVIREKGNDDKTIDLKVNGETILGNDHLILEEIDTFTLTATPNISTTKVEYSYDNGQSYSSKNLPQTLIKGEEKIVYIKITSEDGTSEIRQIKVSREKSSNTELENLMIKEDGFDQVILVYNAQKGTYEYVLKSNQSSNVLVTTYDQENQTITLKNKEKQIINKTIKKSDLVFGENQFYIHVQAENGKDYEEYSLIIIKKSDLKDIIGLEIQDMNKNYATIVEGVNNFVRSGNDFSYELAYAQTSKIRLLITSSERSTIKNSYTSNNEHRVDFTFTSTDKQDHSIAIEVKAENGTIENYTIIIVRKEADSNNFLTDIKVNNETVPEFSKDKFEGYKTMVLDRNQSSVNLQVTKESTLSTVEYFVAGQKQPSSQIPLEPGVLKKVEIRVTAENKQTQSYYINVIAGSQLNEITNINLSNIPATLYTFNSETYVYNISVPYTTEFTQVTATASPYAKISGLSTYPLEEGKTVSFIVYATSESQEESEIKYTFNITRQEPRTYKNLEALEVEINGESTLLNLSQTDLTYKIRIDQHIQNIIIKASVKGDQGETIVGKQGTGFEQNYPIVEGPTGTTITITVIAEDTTTKDYKIIVIRANDENKIDSVEIDGNLYLISSFDENYTLTLPNVSYQTDKLPVKINLVDQTASLTYNYPLKDGYWMLEEKESKLTFYATSQYGTKGTIYTVYVTRNTPNKLNNLASIEAYIIDEKGQVGTENLLSDINIENKNFRIRVNRNISKIQVVLKVLIEDRSKVRDMGEGIMDGKYIKYTKDYTLTPAGTTTFLSYTIEAEQSNLINTYHLEVIRKNAETQIDHMTIKAGTKVLHDGDFTEINLTDIAYQQEKLNITLTKKDSNTKVYINNILQATNQTINYEINLLSGTNQITIKVETDVTKEEYETDHKEETVTLTYTKNDPSTVAKLDSLEVIINGNNILSDTFNPETYIYGAEKEFRVDRSVSTLIIIATAVENGKITGTGNLVFSSYGLNQYKIEVTSESGNKAEYLINIYRNNDNHNITDIKVDGQSIHFNPETYTYDLNKAPYTKDRINIQVTTEDSHATVIGAGIHSLDYKVEEFVIYAVSDFNTPGAEYTIRIEREKPVTTVDLDELFITNQDDKVLPFKSGVYQKGIYSYTIELSLTDEIEFININATLLNPDKQKLTPISHDWTNIPIIKNSNGTINQRIRFEVSAEDNAKQEYEIIIIKGIVLSSDTSVTNIKLTNLYDINFLNYVKDQFIYEVTVDYENEQLKLDVTTPGKVTFIDHLPTRLPVGITKVSFFITAENGQQGKDIYEIHITRSEASLDNTLKEILIKGNGKTILGLQSDALNVFNPEINIYNITLDESYQSITIIRTQNHKKQTLTGTPNSTPVLKHGLNQFTFNVRPENADGFEKTYQVNITVKNSQIELTSLGVRGLSFNETFSKETYHYTLPTVNSKTPEIEIYGTISDTYGEIDGIGKKILKEGINTFEIIVTSEDLQTKKTYTITINVVYSDDYSINEVLLLDQENYNHITFNSEKETYDITVSHNTNSLDLRITANDVNATIVGAKTYAITQKETLITFKVIAENKEESLTYTIKVIKQEASNQATLDELEVTTDQGETILGKAGTQSIFDTDTFTYNLKVSRNIKNVKVTYKTTHDQANLLPTSSHNFTKEITLSPNQNQIYLMIQAEDGKSTERYTINIIQINSEVSVEDISILDYPLEFDQNIKNYDIGKLPASLMTLNITVTLSDIYATVTGAGTQVITAGKNALIIKATSEDKTQSVTYTITYDKESQDGGSNAPKSSDANLYDLKIKGLKNPVEFIFEPLKHEYKITLSYQDDQFFLEADTHPSATTRNIGLQSIQEGETQEIIILVTAEDGTKGDEYKLIITREKANTENELLEFSYILDGEEFQLDVTKSSHNIQTTPDKQSIEVKAKLPENATATGLGVTNLTDDRTIIIITIKAQNGDLKNYVIEVQKISNDATLKSLEVLDVKTNEILPFNLSFDPLKTNYLISLNSDLTTEINILAEATSSLSTVTGDKLHNLKSGAGATTDRFNVIVTAQDKTQKTYTITIERHIAPEHSILIDDLSLTGNNITYLGNDRHPNAIKAFIASQKEYIITVPYQLDNIFLSIINKEGAIITGAGNYALNQQETIINFFIESKSGAVKSETYTIKIIKEDPSTDSLLKDLSLNGKTIDGFDPNIFYYEFNVDVTKVGNLNIGAILNDPKAKITGDLGEVTVLPGINSYKIYVTAEDLSQQVYEIKINSLSYDHQITDLSVENHDLNPIFNPKIFQYEVRVNYETTSVKVHAKSHIKAQIIGTGLIENLEINDNIITVYAISESGVEGLKYQINIIREEPSKDATLKTLVITDKDGNMLQFEGLFDPNKLNYIINIPKEKDIMSVFITAEANSPLATVFNTGNQLLEGLFNGGYHTILKVTVIAQDPSVRNTYTISIYRDVNLDNNTEIQEVNLIANDGKNYLSDNEFNQNITNYQVTVPYHITQMTLNVKTVGQVVGAGIKQFNQNQPIVYTFYTVSQSGSNQSKTYTITVIKEEAKTDNILTNLSIDGIQVPNFDPNTNTYRLARPKQSSSQIQIDATANSFSTIQGTGVKTLTLGKNTFVISVIAQSGDINTYTIEIDYVDSNAFLENLIIKGTSKDTYSEEDAIDYTTYTFDKETYEYNVVVDSNTKHVRVTGAAMDHQNARVTGFGTYPIGINPEKIRIFVTSADNVLTLTYTLNITRYAIPSNNAQLNTLSIENNTISFDKSRYVYEITVSNKIDSLKISAETFNPNGTVVIEGYQEGSSSNELSLSINNLQAGKNVILIKVTAEDGITQNYYRVIVNKEPKTDMLLTVLLILSLLLWIITVLILLINKNRQKNQSTDELIY